MADQSLPGLNDLMYWNKTWLKNKSKNHLATIQTIGGDIEYFSQQIDKSQFEEISALPEIEFLKKTWNHNYEYFSIGNLKVSQFHWRKVGCSFCKGKGGGE